MKETGRYYYSLDDEHQPVMITKGLYRDFENNDLFEIFDADRYGTNMIEMAHGKEDVVIDPQKALEFAQKFDIPIHLFDKEGHSLGRSAETPYRVADLAIALFNR